MNRMTTHRTAEGAWEARIGHPDMYVVRIRATRTRARLAGLRAYLNGTGVYPARTA